MGVQKNESGIAIIAILIVVVVVSMLGFASYNVYDRQKNKPAVSPSSQDSVANQSPKANDVSDAPEIKSTEDLTKAEKSLDQASLDNTNDTSQLDAELVNF